METVHCFQLTGQAKASVESIVEVASCSSPTTGNSQASTLYSTTLLGLITLLGFFGEQQASSCYNNLMTGLTRHQARSRNRVPRRLSKQIQHPLVPRHGIAMLRISNPRDFHSEALAKSLQSHHIHEMIAGRSQTMKYGKDVSYLIMNARLRY